MNASELTLLERENLLLLLEKLKLTLSKGCSTTRQEDRDALQSCLESIDDVKDLVSDLEL